MQEFIELIEVANTLNGPEGCPWDREQTFQTLRRYVLEEAHEVLEAVDNDDDDHMIEELGDLFYTIVFYAKVAERDSRFTMKHILERLTAKLIRRHPHVFGEEKANSIEDVMRTWEKVKKEEKKDRKEIHDGIPKTLPSLIRAAKILKNLQKQDREPNLPAPTSKEEELAHEILDIVHRANKEDIDLENAVVAVISKLK